MGNESPRLATVWRCSCGEPGCGSIRLRVSRENAGHDTDAVVWHDWQMHFGTRTALGPLRFHTQAYYTEFLRAATDRWWEDTPTAWLGNWPVCSTHAPTSSGAGTHS